MKQVVWNMYEEVLLVIGNTLQGQMTVGVYPSIQKGLQAMSGFYRSTVWCEKDEKVKFYGIVTESNGYKHTEGEPVYEAMESDFWDGKKPQILEFRVC